MLRTALLFALLTGIMLAVGWLIGGTSGMTVFLALSVVINFLSYWYSDKIVLGMYRAKEIAKKQEPKLHQIVEKVAKEAEIPKPKIYLVDMPVLNAFATGRSPSHASLAVTSGLMKNLDWGEIEGVVSHEMSHIKSRDMLTASIAATIGGTIAYIAQIAWYGLMTGDRRNSGSAALLPLLILAPIAATLVQLAISRSREYAADYTGAVISKKPLELASALQKISQVAKDHPLKGNSATSMLFIVNPFKADSFAAMFSTHPPVEQRIARLKEIAKQI